MDIGESRSVEIKVEIHPRTHKGTWQLSTRVQAQEGKAYTVFQVVDEFATREEAEDYVRRLAPHWIQGDQ